MASWATERKIRHAATLSFIVIVGVIGAYFLVVYDKPNCFDRLKNQNEEGVDCGGKCARLCENAVSDPTIYFARAFEIRPGIYNLVAYLENKNDNSSAPKVKYVFKLYDDENLLIAEVGRTTFLERNRVTAIFEGAVQTGGRKPARIIFEFEPIEWIKSQSEGIEISAHGVRIDRSGNFPIIKATLQNDTLKEIKNFDVVIIIYDPAGNARTASKTVVDSISPSGSYDISFTWPTEFNFDAQRIEVLPRTYPGINY
jgi:hypothetical protein